CGAISPRSTTSGAVRPKERARRRSFAVSSASWSGKSSAICAVQPSPLQLTKMPIDIYRSINAGLAHRADAPGGLSGRAKRKAEQIPSDQKQGPDDQEDRGVG